MCLSGGLPHEEVIVYFSPAGMVVAAPLPDGVHRIVATVGDAAHVHTPAGGQGMNAGILDAMHLADALPKALAGQTGALVTYGQVRHPVAQQVALAHRLTHLATVPPMLRGLRNAVLATVSRAQGPRRRLAWRLSGLVYR